MNLQTWKEILEEAKRLKLPLENKRGVLREALQTKILGHLYEQKKVEKLQFMGGTALRIIYGAPRFSEDLDFDNFGLNIKDLKKIIKQISRRLENEGIKNTVSWKNADKRAVFAFKKILFDLKISGHKQEKLKINFDQSKKTGKVPHQVFFLSRFDVNERIIVNTPEAILSEKIQALLTRKRVIPRDIFDIAWLLSKNFIPDKAVLKRFGLKQDDKLIKRLLLRTKKLKKGQLTRELSPFLFDQDKLKLLDHFPKLIEKIVKKNKFKN